MKKMFVWTELITIPYCYYCQGGKQGHVCSSCAVTESPENKIKLTSDCVTCDGTFLASFYSKNNKRCAECYSGPIKTTSEKWAVDLMEIVFISGLEPCTNGLDYFFEISLKNQKVIKSSGSFKKISTQHSKLIDAINLLGTSNS